MSQQKSKIQSIFENGSTWLRADFHMHTNADKEFEYEGELNEFTSSYVQALKKADIRIGVITNHNKFDSGQFKALSKSAIKEESFLLPGVELSVKDGSNGIHTLVVFAPDWITNKENKNYIQSFLDVTFAGQANYENENGRSNHDMHDTIRELNKFQRDYFVICAHVEDRSGLWKEMDGGRRGELAKNAPFRERCLGFQKVRTYEQRKVVMHQMEGCYPAEVEGCDCKSIEQIGKGKKTYLKIGSFTFEAVKFALLDHANRVASERPELKHSYIHEVCFEGAKLEKNKLKFSPELNTFIGIRGSGKSSIIESIRYALGIELQDNADRDGYKDGSIKHALGSGGKITINAVDRHNQAYEIRRIVGEYPDVYINGKVQPGINIRETILHKPIYFGQKDLSSTGAGFETELVEKLVGDSLADVRQDISVFQQNIVELVRRMQKLSDVVEKESEYRDKQADAEHRLKVFKKHGVEEKLQKQIDFEQDNRSMDGLTEFVDGFIHSVDDLISEYEDDFKFYSQYRSKRNEDFFIEVMNAYQRVVDGFSSICQIAEDAKMNSAELKAKAKQFESVKANLKEEFAEVARGLSEELKLSGATAIEPDEFLKLRKTIDHAKKMVGALGREKAQQTALQAQLVIELTTLNDKWHEEFRRIKERLEKINEQGTALQIDIEYKEDKGAFLKFIKDLFRGSKLREATLDCLVREFADGAAIYRDFDKAKSVIGNSSETFERYFNDNLPTLLTWKVPNKFTIKYHGKQLKNHSLGQRASALILFVLSQRDNDLVIIDQPEDDLDNQTIYEDVIKLVKKLKPNTQFICATHNPNIPVLGDADQILACQFSEEKIQTKMGSIDCPSQQESIVQIMEGGKEAFQERKRVYKVWKLQNC